MKSVVWVKEVERLLVNPSQMAPSLDCAVPSLLCTEDNSIILDDDYRGLVADFESPYHGMHNRRHSFDVGDGLPLHNEEFLALLLEKECQHLPQADYLSKIRCGDLDAGVRKEAVNWIEMVGAHFGFGPLCAYLSVNYLDRFLSAYELPKRKAWTVQLVAVACLSLAAKVEETEVPLSLDLQLNESKFIFEARTIQRMELLVLSTLKWRIQSITPFSFIDYFLCKINCEGVPHKTSIPHACQVILSTIKGVDFLKFKPSEIAAAVAIYVAGETQTVDSAQALSALVQQVVKERVLECLKAIHNLLSNRKDHTSEAVSSVPQSPIGVLDAACFSCVTDDRVTGSVANSSHSSPDAKRRKLNRPCGMESS